MNKGAGAALMKDVYKMIEMTRAVVRSKSLPVTVKTRIGWNDKSKNIMDIAERLQDTGIQALAEDIEGQERRYI